MIRITLNYFYLIGAALRPLSKVEAGELTVGTYSDLHEAGQYLDGLLRNPVIPLHTSRADGKALLTLLEGVLKPDEPWDEKREITYSDAYDIKTGVEKFETVLAAELEILDTYFVSQKACYSTVDLIMKAEIVLPETIRGKTPVEALGDIRGAGRCLAFDLPTAAGFHILRAVEAVMREYYKAVVGTLPKSKHRNWGAYLKYLKQKGADAKIIFLLEHIKEMHRDPLMHPEVSLTMEEALPLFALAQGVIIAMVKDKEKRIASGAVSLEASPKVVAKAASEKI